MSLSLGMLTSAGGAALKVLAKPKVLAVVVAVAAVGGLGWYALNQAGKAGALEEKLQSAQRTAEENAREAQRLKSEIERRNILAAKHREEMDALETKFSGVRRRLQQAGEDATGRYADCRDARLPGDLVDELQLGAGNKNRQD
jgi:uncharacterized protein HemX